MNPADIAILLVIGVSAILSIFRGLVREVLSLAAWVLAFWAAFSFSGPAAASMSRWITSPSIRWVAGFLLVFMGVLAVAAFVNMLVGRLVAKSGLSGTDRLLGLVFGIARGAVVVAILVFIGQLMQLHREPLWRESSLIPYFEAISARIVRLLPDDLQRQVGSTVAASQPEMHNPR